jgi:hypothetical protein
MPDINALFGSLSATWAKIRADVFFHVFLFLVLFQILHVSMPTLPIPKVKLADIMSSDWYTFAKDTSLLLLAPVVFIGAIVLHGAILRTVAPRRR